MTVDRIIATIDAERFEAIRARYGNPETPDRREKYLDLRRWIDVCLERVQRIGLDTGERRRILDLGCGAGYFLYICKLLGHEVLGLDVPERRSMYTEIRELLGVPCVAHAIRPIEPLPDLGGRFDVVTAHMICFNGHRSDRVWGPVEWERLLDDLDEIGAKTIYLELNAEMDGTLFTPGLLRFFEARDARIVGHRILIDRR